MAKPSIFDVENIGDFNNEELLQPIRNEFHYAQSDQFDDDFHQSSIDDYNEQNDKIKRPNSRKKKSKLRRVRWKVIFWFLFIILTGVFAFLIYSHFTAKNISFSKPTAVTSLLIYPATLFLIWFILFLILLFVTNKKAGAIVLIATLLFANLGVYKVNETLSSFQKLFNNSNSAIKSSNKDVLTEPFTVLILGVDDDGSETPKSSSQPGSGYRSDSMILVSVNPKTHKADMVTTPRDTFLYDKCSSSTQKLNGFIGGGVKCTIDTLKTLYNVEIDYFIQANFNAVVQIVDAIGGIEVDVPNLTESYINWLAQGGLNGEDHVTQSKHNELLNKARKKPQWCDVDSKRNPYTVCFDKFGKQTVDGEHALAFSRSRHYDSDYARATRQTDVIRAIIQKMTSASGIFQIQPILDNLKKSYSIETNMDFQKMIDIMSYSEKLSGSDTASFQVRKHQPLGKNNDGSFVEGSGIFLYKHSVISIRTALAMTLETTPPVPIAESEYYDTIQYPAFKTNGN